MRFTFPIVTLSKGGAQRMLAEVANGLAEKGHDITILLSKSGVIEFDMKATIKVVPDHFPIDSFPPADVIVSNFYTTVPPCQLAAEKGLGTHIRYTHCYEPIFMPNQAETFLSYHVTPHLFVVSEAQKKLVDVNHGLNAKVIPNGINPVFKNLHTKKTNGPLQISAIVRLSEGGLWHRQQNYLIEQLRIVKLAHPEVQINLFCPPAELTISKSLQEIKMLNEFTFHTPANDQELCMLYNQTDIFVTSSIFESSLLTGLEAMACGAALVTTYAGGNMDYAKHYKNCLVSSRMDNQLSKDIMTLIKDPFLRHYLIVNGEAEAKKWTIQRTVDTFEEKAREILTRLGQ
ncbi:glycosyltransferase family 4 protein [Heyndrickxia acidicola]|uniref:Glycosyltransferase family 4 protein n=2 Tax=Heyndrickxia acidicola TaxID=209389 RepID=A0ABU6MJP4_9BACI|nr:glycosyltransferase family 4 protein [Heyndrickxia acidicola]MED1203462.1 glycosyltransferase family 4 protein [Heyndrickxia acidicola]